MSFYQNLKRKILLMWRWSCLEDLLKFQHSMEFQIYIFAWVQITDVLRLENLVSFYFSSYFFFFWCAPFGYLYFLYFLWTRTGCLQESILAWLLHHFHVVCRRDSNPRPLGREPSSLTTTPSSHSLLILLLSHL